MPHDVILPALGMAQESGIIVAWHKQPGDAVAAGDLLFEVETDKATVEVEAQHDGILTGVTAKAGDEVPVGHVIARIAATADDAEDADDDAERDPPAPVDGDLPDGREVIMPTLGMAQDSGLLIGWLVAPGAKVAADDPLFEVETDKSTIEVPAGIDGYLAAQLAQPGEDIPTGQVIAIISPEAPSAPVTRKAAAAPTPPKSAPDRTREPAPPPPAAAQPTRSADPCARILASPKARRLALEQGLDLSRLHAAGVSQPFHAKDIETLRAMPSESAETSATPSRASLHLTAEIANEGLTDFTAWARTTAEITDPNAVLASLAGGSLSAGARVIIGVEAFGATQVFAVTGSGLRATQRVGDATPALLLRDLRHSCISTLRLGAEATPVLTLTAAGGSGVGLTLECAPDQMSPATALAFLTDFAGRLEHPLRALL